MLKRIPLCSGLLLSLSLSLFAFPGAKPAEAAGVSPAGNGISGKVFVGYQGWYGAEGDGFDVGFDNYQYAWKFEPGICVIDYWPDLSEFDEDEKYPTPFKHADGSTAHVFSAANPKTVDRHFKWMKEYGIDGAFLQRFGWALKPRESEKHPDVLAHRNRVFDNVYAAAKNHERLWTLMYDLTSLNKGDIKTYVIEDFKKMVDKRELLDHPYLMRHNGKPLIAIWGVGFKERAYTLEEIMELVTFLKDDPEYGGNAVLLGIPYFWRTKDRDATDDSLFYEIIKKSDVIHPWSHGRYRTPEEMPGQVETILKPNVAWAKEHGLTYMPVIYPGFSWHNLMKEEGNPSPLNKTPRLGGQFLWAQAVAAKRGGADTVYIGMFDEMNEGTQIFKVTSNPPVGPSPFLTYEPHEPDFYLRLSGAIGRLMAGEIEATNELPKDL